MCMRVCLHMISQGRKGEMLGLTLLDLALLMGNASLLVCPDSEEIWLLTTTGDLLCLCFSTAVASLFTNF